LREFSARQPQKFIAITCSFGAVTPDVCKGCATEAIASPETVRIRVSHESLSVPWRKKHERGSREQDVTGPRRRLPFLCCSTGVTRSDRRLIRRIPG